MRAIAAVVSIVASVVAIVVAARWQSVRAQRAGLVCLSLRLPRQLELEAIEGFLVGLVGLLPPWWRRWLSSPVVILEVKGGSAGIVHRILAPAGWVGVIRQQLQVNLPGIRFDESEVAAASVGTAAEYRLSTSRRPLRMDPIGISTRLLGSLQPLREGESVVVQWLMTPAGLVKPVESATKTSGAARWWQPGQAPSLSGEAATALRKKHEHPLLLACGRIGVGANSRSRALQLLRHAEVAWHGTRAPGVHLRRRWLPLSFVARRLTDHRAPLFEWPAVLNVRELAGLIGWPIGGLRLPGLQLGGCRELPPSPQIASEGTVLADSTYPGASRPIALDLEARLRHVHVLGPTGTGKSTLLLNAIVSDLDAGAGMIVVDAKGDLVDDVLSRVPGHRRADVIVLDPSDTARPVGLNPLADATNARAEVVVENLVGLLKSLYRSSWGPRTDDILRAALSTLAATGTSTLCEVPLILTNEAFRRQRLARLDDPIGLESFWGWYQSLSDAERINVIGPVLNKVRAFTMRPTVRAIVGQASPTFSMGEVLASGGVLLVSLASGLLGTEASALLGALVVAELWHAISARAGLSSTQRQPVMAYLDEWQQFLHLPTPMAEVLAQARGLGLGLVLAHQHLDQLPLDVRAAVLGNARSRVVFQLPAADARIIARELGGALEADELTKLGAHEVVISPFAAGATQPPVTGRTRPAPSPRVDGHAIRAASRQRFGVDREAVDAAIRARQQPASSSTSIRRRPVRGAEDTT